MRASRVLVVEDNQDAAQALAMLLRASGHAVATASSGDEGLEAARSFRPDVVISDVRLPGGIDGFELARRIKSDPSLRDVLLVAMSGLTEPEPRESARSAGFDHYLAKPADPAELLRLLAAARGRE